MERHPVFSAEPIEQAERILSKGTTSVHVTALDGLVNVNSLFTVAVFIGLSLESSKSEAQGSSRACVAGNDTADNLFVFEVVSFSSFLFSSLVAYGLKLAIILNNSKLVNETIKAYVNNTFLRLGMLASACGSVVGSTFLVLSMVNVIQIRLGTLSCRTTASVGAVVALISLVSTALVIYISTVLYAFTH